MTKVLVRLGLIALLIYAGVTFWYGWVEKSMLGTVPSDTRQPAAPPEEKVDDALPAANDYGIILTRNIFQASLEPGKAPSGEAPGQEGTEDLAETRMQLVLLGTVSGSKEDARAIIRDEKTKMEDIYRVGSELNGASISRIGRGKVVLQVNGREEVLNIKDPESSGASREAAPATAAGRRDVRAEAKGTTGPVQTEEVGQSVPRAVPRRRINFRNAAPAPPSESEPPSLPADQPIQLEEPEQAAPSDQMEPPFPQPPADAGAPPETNGEGGKADDQRPQ